MLDFYESMNRDLKSLGEGASFRDVPKGRQPTPDSLEKSNAKLRTAIAINRYKAAKSFEKARNSIVL